MFLWKTLDRQPSASRRVLGWERVVAGMAVVNLGLVAFNFSYLNWRSFYHRYLPGITRLYDPLKGIRPHPETVAYLQSVDQLTTQIQRQGLNAAGVTEQLRSLQRQSQDLILSNAFVASGQSATQETLNRVMRDRLQTPSTVQAWSQFWSPARLSPQAWPQELAFFNQQIRPRLAANYYRPVNAYGQLPDYFFWLDLPFMVLFALDFVGRTRQIQRERRGLSHWEAMLWRWYDVPLFLPFLRWLRVLPVLLRLHQTHLLDLNPVLSQANRGIAANFVDDLTEAVILRVLSQTQTAIRRGDFSRWLLNPETRRPYLDLNNINEVETITHLMVRTTLFRVLPQVQPDIEALLRHTLASAISQTQVYRVLEQIPGFKLIPQQMTERLATEMTQSVYTAVVNSLEDATGVQLLQNLVQHFGESLATEIQHQQTLTTIRTLLVDLLEEIKLNYVKNWSEADWQVLTSQVQDGVAIAPP